MPLWRQVKSAGFVVGAHPFVVMTESTTTVVIYGEPRRTSFDEFRIYRAEEPRASSLSKVQDLRVGNRIASWHLDLDELERWLAEYQG